MQSILRSEFFGRAVLAVGCFALLIFFFSPPWAAFAIWTRIPEVGGMIEVRRASAMIFQLEHLGEKIPDELHGVIQWRLLPPLVGRFLHLAPPYFFGLAHVGCIAVLGFAVTVLRRNRLTWWTTAGVTLTFGAASWLFTSVSWLGYFDSWLVLGLLLVAFGESRWTVWAACALAPWADERFVIAMPLALICRHIYQRESGSAPGLRTRNGTTIIAGALIVVFAVVRLGFLARYSGPNATVGGYFDHFASFDAPLTRIFFGAWTGWRLAWVFAFCGIAALWRHQRTMSVVLAIATAAVAIVGLATAQDFSRSMMLLAPVSLLGAVWTLRDFRIGRWMPAIVSLSLIFPAHHVMSDRVVPIYYLYHELAAFESPPAAVTPELHELKGILAMQRGEYVAAAEALSLAIKLARNPASASKQRGVLFASQQQWKQARDDFSVVTQHEPRNPDGWFLRAQAELALGNPTAAAADFKQALAVAGPGWAERADVTRFRSRLEPR